MKKKRIVLAAVFLWVLLSAGVAHNEPVRVAPPKDMAALKKMMALTWDMNVLPAGASARTLERLLTKGEVVIMNDNPVKGVPWMAVAGVLVDAPQETVFGTATDFDYYPEMVPMTGKAHAEPVAGMPELYEVNFGIELLFSWLSIDYSVYHFHRPPHRTDWAHASGEFDVNSGFWQFLPTEDGRHTMTFYSVYSLPRQSAIRALYRDEPALELMTNVATATMVVRAIKAEAEKRYGRKLPPLTEKAPVEKILTDDPETLRLLAERGKVLVLEPGPTVYATAGIVVDAPVETAYKVITDFQKYQSFIPGVKKVEMRGQGAKGPKVYQEYSVKLFAFNLSVNDELEYTLEPPNRMTWMIPRENGGEIMGFWRLIPLENNTKCLMFNGSTEDIRSMGFIPSTAIKLEPTLEYGLIAAQVIAGMDAFKKRIYQAAGRK
ncbi:MAG TPA: SRPBCC family protein [bacterium]|nr:SRPBCC family protein [bacterium]